MDHHAADKMTAPIITPVPPPPPPPMSLGLIAPRETTLTHKPLLGDNDTSVNAVDRKIAFLL